MVTMVTLMTMVRSLFWHRFVILGVLLVGGLVLLGPQVLAAPPDQGQEAAEEAGPPEQTVLLPLAAEKEAALHSDPSDYAYVSPVTEARQPFTHVLVRWETTDVVSHTHAHEPELAPALEIRVSRDGNGWEAWQGVEEDHELWLPEDGDNVFWSPILYAGEGMRFWQVRAGAAGHPLDVRRIEVNTVDGRLEDEHKPQASATPARTEGAALASVGKPPVVSRTAWGCPDGQGSRQGVAYHAVNHLVVHHTAGSNTLGSSERNWATRVRAIWNFHTYTRGWGDVGYNYLIDPDGVIYEGRAGGDNGVGFHDTGNYGSMGVSLIGTYASVVPGVAMQESLVELLAWKAAQQNIDPFGQSYYYGCDISNYCRAHAPGAVVANIAGHRHVTPGHTTCPGDEVVSLLPSIRQRVATAIEHNGMDNPVRPDNGDLLIEELETSFTPSDATWYRAACGDGGHTFYTYATDAAEESTNAATWRPSLPESGYYRLYAHIPQGCGLGSPPYASTNAVYHIHSAEGVAEQVVDHNTAETWVDLGAYAFEAGTGGYVELSDLTGEPYRQRRVIFFDSVKWVPDEPPVQTSAELLHVSYDRPVVAAGEVLKVTFTIRNSGNTTISGQSPTDGYVYREQECFLGDEAQTTPAYPKEEGFFRVVLGPLDREVACAGEAGGYPWRWSIGEDLEPGETREVVGYVWFDEPGAVTLHAGLIEEYVQYHAEGVAPATIGVTEEHQPPVPVLFDASLHPAAQVYHLGSVSESLLRRTLDPRLVVRGDSVGSFAWDGSLLNWGDGGPVGVQDQFLVEQTRAFLAPTDGGYVFRTTSDDGSWLWVDGHLVVANGGVSGPDPAASSGQVTATLTLTSGLHVLSFKYFEQGGAAMAGYSMQGPGEGDFAPPPDATRADPPVSGNIFAAAPRFFLTADDQGGSGVASLRYSWDGSTWTTVPALVMGKGGTDLTVVDLGELGTGRYHLRYQAEDRAGNQSPVQEVVFEVQPDFSSHRLYMPLVMR